MFATEIAMQRDAGAEGKGLALKCLVDRREISEAATREVIEIAIVGGSEQSFAPGEEGLGIYRQSRLVELSFTIHVAPPKLGASCDVAYQRQRYHGFGMQDAGMLVREQNNVNTR